MLKINNNRQNIIEYLFKSDIIHKTKNGKIHVHKLPKELIQKKPPLKEAFIFFRMEALYAQVWC